MRTLFLFLFSFAFLYAVIGIGVWYQWRIGVSNPNLAQYPDDIRTFLYIVKMWPWLVV